MAKLTFHGGAQSVTGANYLLEAGGLKILVDCGLFQGSRFSEEYNYEKFAYNPAEVDYLFVTHSHADHMGRIPKLFKDGFRGKIITTEPTRAVIEVALPDTLEKILDEARQMGHEPLYSREDVHNVLKLFSGTRYREVIRLNDSVNVTFHESSHILGAAVIEINFKDDAVNKRILFTGDLGNPPTTLLNPIDYVVGADYLVIESAYGNRIHEDRLGRQDILIQTIRDTVKRGGVLMIPSFAIERTQELLFELDSLFVGKEIPQVPVFLDSPLAVSVTHVYEKCASFMNPEAQKILRKHGGLFRFPWLTFTSSVAESKKINEVYGSKIIIAGSGMSTGGRILHHEARYLPDPQNCILFVGYQVAGSLGRRILDEAEEVRIFGQPIPVRCEIKAIGAYSAHADQDGLTDFVRRTKEGDKLKRVFVVQGEEEAAVALADRIAEDLQMQVSVPLSGQEFAI